MSKEPRMRLRAPGGTTLFLKRGPRAEGMLFIGQPDEIVFFSDTRELRVHDGETPGGHPLTMVQAFDNDFTAVPLERIRTVQALLRTLLQTNPGNRAVINMSVDHARVIDAALAALLGEP